MFHIILEWCEVRYRATKTYAKLQMAEDNKQVFKRTVARILQNIYTVEISYDTSIYAKLQPVF